MLLVRAEDGCAVRRDLRADLDVVGSSEGAYGVGDITEFCLGGPAASARMQSHLARFLPGVSVLSYAAESPASYLRDSYRRISSVCGNKETWCVVLRVVAPSVYGPSDLVGFCLVQIGRAHV